ncbi:ABC transporter substrate-binding protein [Pseudonocardia sp. WMMC193]|uniref:ABC transporter substrate-binding protein n=1 Tax=Pseudonocardia sp. WMMC193 TaxID=2911965 RepID=UPI001F408430|nr:ABC transporter substrate-binding protein [Pseudonocardia sp. WMMC193]MCF7549418.1 ABC transporter substrate-binding protein [Pseudonocardia sp. WMMC193]
MKRTLAAVASFAAAALVLAGCGSGDDSSAAAGGLTGEPVLVGVLAPMDGATAYPQTGYGAQAAEQYINEKLGGIGGRPIKIDLCAGDGSPETAVNCANQFVTENVVAVFDAYDGSVGGAVPVLTAAKIPIIGELGATAVVDSLPWGQSFYFSGPLETSALGMVTILNQIGKTNASLAVTDGPPSHGYVDKLVMPAAKNLGMNVTPLYVPGNNMNFNVMAATELSTNPDVAGIIALTEDGCTGLFKALRAQGYGGTLFAGSCSQFIAQLGPDAAGAIVQPRVWVPAAKDNAPPEVKQQLEDFAASMEAIDRGDQQSARSLYSFAGMVNLATVLKGIQGEINPETVTAAMKAVKDMPTFAGPTVTCDGQQWANRPASCSHEAIFFEVQADGSMKPVDPNGFIALDPSKMSAA